MQEGIKRSMQLKDAMRERCQAWLRHVSTCFKLTVNVVNVVCREGIKCSMQLKDAMRDVLQALPRARAVACTVLM